MSSEVVAVLLIPAKGDPLGLLANGLCGARQPMAWLRGRRDGIWRAAPWFPDERLPLFALVLAWDSEPVPEGLLRIMVKGDALAPLKRWVRGMLKRLREPVSSLGTIVLIDADGREVHSDQL